mmetsp:Transcript_11590/g.38372  ORF Transcript_11590/g.38372 Transcript_11590/m.38372 type:complete len:223 (+) Transcript_11590:1468-2136(+)
MVWSPRNSALRSVASSSRVAFAFSVSVAVSCVTVSAMSRVITLAVRLLALAQFSSPNKIPPTSMSRASKSLASKSEIEVPLFASSFPFETATASACSRKFGTRESVRRSRVVGVALASSRLPFFSELSLKSVSSSTPRVVSTASFSPDAKPAPVSTPLCTFPSLPTPKTSTAPSVSSGLTGDSGSPSGSGSSPVSRSVRVAALTQHANERATPRVFTGRDDM